MTRDHHVLILSAPVGAGHDVAARRLARDIEEAGASVEVDDGLALLGPRLERFVVSTYRFQLDRAVWSWRVLYAVTRHAWTIRILGWFLALIGGRRLERRIAASGAGLVVSTYPLVSAALAALRRRGRLPARCVTLITDFDLHPAWIHRDLDANLSASVAGHGADLVQPPVGSAARATGVGARDLLGIAGGERMALIVGGAWGVGPIEAAALTLAGVDGVRTVVVTGRNEALRERLLNDTRLEAAIVLGYREDLPELLAASDVLIQHAGGLTCAEAFALGVPLVMFDPIKGHGVANSRCMVRAGVATLARDAAALTDLVTSDSWWEQGAVATARAGRLLFERPRAFDHAVSILTVVQPQRPTIPLAAPGRFVLVLATLVGFVALALERDGLRDAAVLAAHALT